jgi:ribosome maturation factor RimP
MLNADILARITATAETLLSANQLELVDLEVRREGRVLVLCLYIDKDGGVTLDDCAAVSRELSSLLDVDDFIAERYTLEVSSPGLNRPLKKKTDFERSIGKLVKIKTSSVWLDEAGNRRKTFYGQLVELSGESAVIALKEGQRAVIPLDVIAKANLEFEF